MLRYNLRAISKPRNRRASIGTTSNVQFKSVPVVDLSGIGEEPATNRIAQKIDEAARTVGFFYISNHGISPQLSDDILKLGKEFFALPEIEKLKYDIRKSKTYRGYQKLGINITQGKRDWHEAIDFFQDDKTWNVHNPAFPLHGLNQWPASPPQFREVYTKYIESMLSLGDSLMSLFALALGLEKNYFMQFTNNSFWILRVIGYPPIKNADTTVTGEARARYNSDPQSTAYPLGVSGGTHSDYGCLTMVNQSGNVCALQAQNVAGEWIDVPPLPGTFVVNIGDMLSHWTGGQYKSTPHRILNNSDKYRVSVPFFFEPNYDAIIRPITSLQANPKPIIYGEYLVNKITNNFDFKEIEN